MHKDLAIHFKRCATLSLALLCACGSGTVPPPPPPPTNVGPAGGTLELAGGTVTLRVPAGSLSAAVQIEARATTALPGSGGVLVPGTTYELSPTDLRMAIPASITVRYADAAVPGEVTPSELRLYIAQASTWTQVARSRADPSGSVSGEVQTLGTFGVLGVPIDRVVVRPENVRLGARNEVVLLSAEARDADGVVLPKRPIVWSTSDSTHARVNTFGHVVASTESAAITATSAGKTGSATVEVKPGAATPFLLEDFSSYAGTANFISNPRGYYVRTEDSNTQDIVLDQNVGFGNSSQSMRYDFPDRTAEGPARCQDRGRRRVLTTSPPYVNRVGPGVTHVWVDIWMKFSRNFTVTAPASWLCTTGQGYKLQGATVFGPDAGRFMIQQLPNDWTVEIPDNSVLFGRNILGPVVNGAAMRPRDLYDNRWHRIRYEMKISSSPGVADGVFNGWMDNQVWFRSGPQVINRSTIWGILLGINMNQGPAELQQLWYGRLALFVDDPSW